MLNTGNTTLYVKKLSMWFHCTNYISVHGFNYLLILINIFFPLINSGRLCCALIHPKIQEAVVDNFCTHETTL